jgi:Tfp pilus assembly protein PilX
MKLKTKNNGTALLMVIFIVAILAAVVMGMLQINTEDIQIIQNQIFAAESMAIAEAGLNDAFYELRNDDQWDTGFTNKSFSDGSYTVEVQSSPPNLKITSTGTSSHGFISKVFAKITVGSSSPHTISIEKYIINDEE